jgi:transposase-like protein
MVKCPNCKKEQNEPKKTWKYRMFEVQAYSCNNCGTGFREYTKAGKHSFTLKRPKKGRAWIKV